MPAASTLPRAVLQEQVLMSPLHIVLRPGGDTELQVALRYVLRSCGLLC